MALLAQARVRTVPTMGGGAPRRTLVGLGNQITTELAIRVFERIVHCQSLVDSLVHAAFDELRARVDELAVGLELELAVNHDFFAFSACILLNQLDAVRHGHHFRWSDVVKLDD